MIGTNSEQLTQKENKMSMNLHVDGRQKAVLDSGKEIEIVKRFDLYQTPTEITDKAMKGNPLEVYCDWVMETWGTEESVGHLERLKEWIKTMENDGYVIDFFEM